MWNLYAEGHYEWIPHFLVINVLSSLDLFTTFTENTLTFGFSVWRMWIFSSGTELPRGPPSCIVHHKNECISVGLSGPTDQGQRSSSHCQAKSSVEIARSNFPFSSMIGRNANGAFSSCIHCLYTLWRSFLPRDPMPHFHIPWLN